MLKRCMLGLLAALLLSPGLFAQSETAATAGAGEDEFFGSGAVEAAQGTAEKKNIAEDIEKERVGLSGILQATGSYTMTRNFVQGITGAEDNSLSNVMMGDFLVDVRLKKSFRAFVDLNLGYLTAGTPVIHNFTEIAPVPGTPLVVSEDQTTLLGVKEIFLDFNAGNTVYFRAGKQVLQWGTGYFWNPTDLINIEHKSFTNLNALREGVFGLRSDVVFAREFHLYTFLNLNALQDITDVAFAARSEFLVGAFEFGFSGWFKSGKIPVFGVDLTSPLPFSLNLTAEASFSWGDNQDKLDVNGLSTHTIRDQIVPKVDVGLSRSFDAFDVQDRIRINAEFFYNGAGYDVNMLQSLGQAGLATFLSGYYLPGYYGQYYGALFVTVSKFIVSDMTLTLSGLANLSDTSGIAMVAFAYAPVNNFELSLQLGSYLGPDNSEYTISPSTSGGSNMFFISLGAKVNF